MKNKESKTTSKGKKKGLIIALGIICGLVIIAGVVFFGTDSEVEATELEDGQRIVYGEIVQANGNEITYMLTTVDEEALAEEETAADEEVTEVTSEEAEGMSGEKSESRGNRMSEDGSGEMPEMTDEMMENMSEGRPGMSEDGSGEMPEMTDEMMENMSEGRPGMSEDGSGEMPEMTDEMMENMPDRTQNGEMEEESSESSELYTVIVPVGTEVTTKLGTITTFSWLEAGDIIKMIVEDMEDGSEEIIAIEIIE